ncbi:MAG: DUF2807 domain-containing protein, partial [Flavobacterium sp.]
AGVQPLLASYPINISTAKNKIDERDVRDFNGVIAGGPITVIITLGNTEGVRFEGDADAIATLITEKRGTALVIRPQNSWTSWARKYQGKKITAYVSAKTIKSLTMSGDGKMSVTNKIDTEGLNIILSGSGSITANINVNGIVANVSGSGSLNLSGSADNANVNISGSGSLAKKGFTVGNLSSVISGSGSVYANVEDSINATISGSGSINYSGDPEVKQRVFGSGRVRKI